MKNLLIGFILLTACFLFPSSISAANYYIAPDKDLDGTTPNIVGSDTHPGTLTQPWKTFTRALSGTNYLRAGDTLYLLDGIYYQSISPHKRNNGASNNYTTIKALSDGKAIIDGQHSRIPITLEYWEGVDYMLIEGIVAMNGTDNAVRISTNSDYNILRRISAYNADKDGNSFIIEIDNSGEGNQATNNLIEDCVAAGTGRKAIGMNYNANNNIIRRCFADWHRWDGLNWHDQWPWGENIDVYNAHGNIIENSISFGQIPRYGITIRRNKSEYNSDNNQVLGSIAVFSSINKQTWQPVDWTVPPAGKTACCDDPYNYHKRVGLEIFGYSSGTRIDNTIIRDFLAYGNASTGLALNPQADPNSTILERITLYNNTWESKGGIPVGTDMIQADFDELASQKGNTITNSYISNVWNGSSSSAQTGGQGAKYNLLNRHYEKGVLKEGTFWNNNGKWPMEERIMAEYAMVFGIQNFSVTDTIKPLIENAPSGNENPPPLPTQGPSATPTPTQVPTATPTTGPSPTPQQGELVPIAVIASADDGNVPENTIDNNLATRWSSAGLGEWIQYDLGTPMTIDAIAIAWYRGNIRTSTFEIQGSNDLQTWTVLYPQTTSNGVTADFETYDLADTAFRYVRIIGYGNSDSTWNSINEVDIFMSASSTQPGDTDSDGDVDIFDYNAVLGNMGTSTGASRSGGDLDGDGDVDIFDYNEIISNFGK